ncbi:39S ribosomal protein L10, mitochondrial [Apodemus speciosus]|uniref:Large ribosomal subunit protein uL10m n=1 Tax=Apodemus speciosus TaxID=105296 RepID=A0ABQ0FBV7_APOSI
MPWLPTLQTVRYGSKAVTRHWRVMHFQRQKLMAVTEYIPPRPACPPSRLCAMAQGGDAPLASHALPAAEADGCN